MIATKHLLTALKAVTNNSHPTISTAWREHMDRALEAVECVGSVIGNNLKGLVVFVAARIAFLHPYILLRVSV
jgi:hypothetical protein